MKRFEAEMDELAKRKVPSKVDLDYPVDAHAISQEAAGLIKKFGETMEFYQLAYSLIGAEHGLWTCLSMKAKNGDMCDDTTVYFPGVYNSTPAWHAAPHIQKLLKPIDFALRRVRLSVMHPATMVSWHCDDCPRDQMGPPDQCRGHVPQEHLRRKWKNKFHGWVRLHLILSDNSDIEFGIGGLHARGTTNGAFYLANVAMPHRVDNKGDGTRVALLVDVRMKGMEKGLQQSELGRSILKAVTTVKAADGADTYLQMGRSLYTYLCGISSVQRYETEWHGRAWSRPVWRPLPPFTPKMFNSPGHCGLLGPPENKRKLEELEAGRPDRRAILAQLPRTGRRRRRQSPNHESLYQTSNLRQE
jgi:hypothetical protein